LRDIGTSAATGAPAGRDAACLVWLSVVIDRLVQHRTGRRDHYARDDDYNPKNAAPCRGPGLAFCAPFQSVRMVILRSNGPSFGSMPVTGPDYCFGAPGVSGPLHVFHGFPKGLAALARMDETIGLEFVRSFTSAQLGSV
jgi:hypothetical protein